MIGKVINFILLVLVTGHVIFDILEPKPNSKYKYTVVKLS